MKELRTTQTVGRLLTIDKKNKIEEAKAIALREQREEELEVERMRMEMERRRLEELEAEREAEEEQRQIELERERLRLEQQTSSTYGQYLKEKIIPGPRDISFMKRKMRTGIQSAY